MDENSNKDVKKPVYKKVWFWILIVIGILFVGGVIGGMNPSDENNTNANNTNAVTNNENNIVQNNNTNNTNTNNDNTTTSTKINLDKFNKIKTGMTYKEVVAIIGEEGTVISENNITGDEKYHTIMYQWKGSNLGANANVTIQGGKVVSKAQYGLK